MEPLGFNWGLLLVQSIVPVVLFVFPLISLIDLARKNLAGMPLAIWVLVICVVPVIGASAYWIIKPTPEKSITM